MCGICGEIDFNKRNIKPGIVRAMCDVLAHRGPDDEGMVFIRANQCYESRRPFQPPPEEIYFEVALGHKRLSIIDLSTAAHQPMCNEDGRIWIVFNGEIYNFQDLRKTLIKNGHLFKSNSDTEVILHAYEEWDVNCLNAFRGMFAFAIWDCNRRRLFLARDRLGKKPLAYFNKNGHFAFASEIKALLQIPEVERKVNHPAIHYYLTYQYVPSPETIFESLKKLPPAHYLLYDFNGNMTIERYWKLRFNSTCQSQTDIQEWEDLVRTELRESVRLRLVSDVPLGAFLSGGVDSSLVVGLMSGLTAKPVKTFSIGFEEKDFNELSYAKLVSRHFSTEHNEFVVRPNAIEILPKLAWYYNEPFADSSAIPTYYVANMTRDYVKVVLTGDASDENFAGYRRYLFSQWVPFFTTLPEIVRKRALPGLLRILASTHIKESRINRLADFLEMLTFDPARNYAEQIKIFNANEKKAIYTEGFADSVGKLDALDFLVRKFNESGTDDFLERLLYLDINSYLPEDLLVKMDLATMANSLEARVPFLDHKFLESVAAIPSCLKLKGFKTKFVLKAAFKDFLPEVIFKRRKMGFGVPLSRWFRNELKDYTYEILLDSRTLNRGYFKREGVERLLDHHVESRYDHSAKIWALLFLEIWFRVFIDKEGDSFLYGA